MFHRLTIVFAAWLVGHAFSCCGVTAEKPAKYVCEINRCKKEGACPMPEKENKKKTRKEPHVVKKVLKNGMTILVRVVRTIPKVSMQIWYNVGSKDEQDGEKGIAHLIEHMIFKGTKKLSESDINLVVHKLSGRCNAFTSYDFTGYLFDMPTHHWQKILPIIADCMVNVAFKDEHLNSEMKAVIQELKMGNDQHVRSLAYGLLGLMFAGHPYHYPLIGYKQDLWTVRGKDLLAFYKKHYLPNNATLIIVGDVEPEEAFALAEKQFGSIPADESYKKEKHYFHEDIVSRSLTYYRDVQLPVVMLAFRLPGSSAKFDHAIEVISRALLNGKSSRLHKKLVDELQLVTSIGAINWQKFEHGTFYMYFEPKSVDDLKKIEAVIFDEVRDVAHNGLHEGELESAIKRSQMKYYSKLEDSGRQASDIGKAYLATGDEQYAFTYLDVSPEQVQKDVKKLAHDYFREAVVHRGQILPLPESEKKEWERIQAASDALDNEILSARIRTTGVEPPRYAQTVTIEEPGFFEFPKSQEFTLSNGVKVFQYHHDNTPKINIIVSLKAKGYYDSDQMPGLYNFVVRMLPEGTKNYTAAELAEAIESRGMSFSAAPGVVVLSMLSVDFEKGLELLEEILSRPIFDKREMNKVREQLFAEIKEFWDTPTAFSSQLVKERVYEGHPYSKNILGTADSVGQIKQKDLEALHKKFVSPDGARVAIVGDLAGYDVQAVVEKHLGFWDGPQVADIKFPKLAPVKPQDIDHYINRDQVVLCFAGLSVDRKHEDYDKLWLFDQIFGGGVLHSMSARLIQLREQSGLFYAIGGTLTAGANEQPGMVMVKTLVSLDRLAEAEKAIKHTIDTAVDSITPQEFAEARRAIVNSLVNNFESNGNMAATFLFLDRYNLPHDYFDKRGQELLKVSIEDVQKAVKKWLRSGQMVTVRAGRVGKSGGQEKE